FPHEPGVAGILRIDRHGRVAQQRLGPRGGDREEGRGPALHWVADVVELALRVPRFGLFVGQRRETVRAPMDHAVAAVDEPFFPQTHEHLAYRAGVRLVQREAGSTLVARAADHLELLEDRGASLVDERPYPDDQPCAS